MQLHPEVTVQGLECWLIGYALELATEGIDPAYLIGESKQHAQLTQPHATFVLAKLVDQYLIVTVFKSCVLRWIDAVLFMVYCRGNSTLSYNVILSY